MSPLATLNKIQIQQHHAIHAHLKFLINAVGKLDLSVSPNHIAEPKALKNHIALYRWSVNDFKKALQRDIELNKNSLPKGPLSKEILDAEKAIMRRFDEVLKFADKAMDSVRVREELNVILVKINLAVNSICDAILLVMAREELLNRIRK